MMHENYVNFTFQCPLTRFCWKATTPMNLLIVYGCYSLRLLPSRIKDALGKTAQERGAWVAQSVRRPTSAHVMISRSVGSVGLCADRSEPGACFRFCVSPSLCPSLVHALSLSQK